MFLADLVRAGDQLSADLGGDAIINVSQIRDIVEQRLDEGAAGFSGSEIGKKFIDKFIADLSVGRQGDKLPLEQLRKTLEDSDNAFEESGGILKNFVESLSKSLQEARKLEQLTIDRLVQEKKITNAIRDIDFRKIDLRRRVGEITGDRKGTLAEAQADLRSRVGALTGGITDPNRILQNIRADRDRVESLNQKRRSGQTLTEEEAQEFVDLQSNIADNTQALKELSEDTTQLAAVQNRIAELQAKQDASRKGLVGLLGRLGEVQNRARAGDFKGAREQALEIRKTFATVQKLQQGIPLNLDEAAKVLGGELDQLLLDLGGDPEQIRKAIDNGFKVARGAAVGGLAQIGVQLPDNAFENVNLGDQIDDQKDIAKKIGQNQEDAFTALQKNLDAGRAFIEASTELIKGQLDVDPSSSEKLNIAIGQISKLGVASEGVAQVFDKLKVAAEEATATRDEERRNAEIQRAFDLAIGSLDVRGLLSGIQESLNDQGLGLSLEQAFSPAELQESVVDSALAALEQQARTQGIDLGDLENAIRKSVVGEEDWTAQQVEDLLKSNKLIGNILKTEQGPNSFSVFDNQANKKLDEQNKLTEKETSKADKRFPPRSAFGRTASGGTASGPVSITAICFPVTIESGNKRSS